ncbi:hypothetical protein AVEN_62286-1 [Araneus ventricosus]|uniref:Uncharacterized protein n=1 Tax=Araneus ventricosus TaxID=182803 RepID=A0A4Y2P1P9_ARAVE|nr:hypothetical protein AVEN_62286-1 [Araneus ventricosus]
MEDGICPKRYPHHFRKETQLGQDRLYRRRSSRDGRFTANISFRGLEVPLDNTWIVPYCPFLTKIFIAHINVEYSNSVKTVKYFCKYVNKASNTCVWEIT